MITRRWFPDYFDSKNEATKKAVMIARMFSQRPSKLIDPNNRYGNIFAFEYDYFCSTIAIQLINEDKLL